MRITIKFQQGSHFLNNKVFCFSELLTAESTLKPPRTLMIITHWMKMLSTHSFINYGFNLPIKQGWRLFIQDFLPHDFLPFGHDNRKYS